MAVAFEIITLLDDQIICLVMTLIIPCRLVALHNNKIIFYNGHNQW